MDDDLFQRSQCTHAEEFHRTTYTWQTACPKAPSLYVQLKCETKKWRFKCAANGCVCVCVCFENVADKVSHFRGAEWFLTSFSLHSPHTALLFSRLSEVRFIVFPCFRRLLPPFHCVFSFIPILMAATRFFSNVFVMYIVISSCELFVWSVFSFTIWNMMMMMSTMSTMSTMSHIQELTPPAQ